MSCFDDCHKEDWLSTNNSDDVFDPYQWSAIKRYLGDHIKYITSEDTENWENFCADLKSFTVSGKELDCGYDFEGTAYLVDVAGVEALIVVDSPVDLLCIRDPDFPDIETELAKYRDAKSAFEKAKHRIASLSTKLGQDQKNAENGGAYTFLKGYLAAKAEM